MTLRQRAHAPSPAGDTESRMSLHLIKSSLYYFLGVFDLLWFFIFLGDRIYDETKTTVFYVIMWGFHYVVIIASEFGIQNLWITYGVYFVVWLVVLLIYGSLVSNNHHNFGYYIE